MKSKEQKRREAVERSKKYKFENSKACRLGTGTKKQWTERNKAISN